MTDHTNDFRELYKLRELEDLLFSANRRYNTARATVCETVDGTRASRTAKRFHDYATERGMVYHLYSRDEGASEDESVEIPPDHFSWIWTIRDSEETTRVWYERPDRYREEKAPSDLSGTAYEVVDGGQRWVYKPPDEVLYTPDNFAAKRKWPMLLRLLDPSLLLYHLDPVLARVTDRVGTYAGRETLEVEARIISLDYIPRGLSGVDGADGYVLSVDRETGVILRFAEKLGGEEFYAAETTEISFDGEFPEGTFKLDLPGVSSTHRER